MMNNKMTIKTLEFPSKVADVLGAEAANAFEQWINQKLQGTAPHTRTIEIPAKIARQKVNVLILERIGNLLLADEPYLVEIEPSHWVWRVPVDLTYSTYGRVGRVAEIDVDAYYGMIDYTDTLLAEIKTKAQQLVREVRQKPANAI
ncbi:MAG: hypothetical protein ACOYNY_17790 [Caldilineaceae bacterium]|jgi:hypothetical protein